MRPEPPRAATNFQRVLTVIGKVSQKDIVIVIVLRPAFSVEQREAIEVCLNGGHGSRIITGGGCSYAAGKNSSASDC